MKIITVIAQQVSADALNAALPADGIVSVTVSETQSFSRTATTVGSYRGVKLPQHFTPIFRIEMLVEDNAADQVIEGIAFARGAGLLGDARAWVSAEATDLFTTSTTMLAASA
jgi:nitrogen regulatory protein P-II 1